jgi:thiamine pyrophosphate-dependent acetolactate synthase large subunit-like protein
MKAKIHRRALVDEILADRDENLLVVAGLGSSCWDVCNAGDSPRNFYVWGAMGGAAMIGYGIARAQRDKRVLVITGDGDSLMGLGAYATIASAPVDNLAILVLDNGAFGETGGQPTHTVRGADLAAIAKGAGIPVTATFTDPSETDAMKELLLGKPGPVVAIAKIVYEPLKFVLPSNSGSYLKDRFRVALLGDSGA